MFFEGGDGGVPNEDAEEFRGCLGEILLDILLEVDEVMVENNPAYNIRLHSFHIPHELHSQRPR